LLVRADVLANAGRNEEAVGLAREVASKAEQIEQPSLLAAALLGEARASIWQHDRSAVGALLGRALELAIAEDLPELAAEAMTRRLYLRGLASGGSQHALVDVPIAEAMIARAGGDPELRALLLNNQGAIQAAVGNREAAREAFARALVLKERLFGSEHLEIAVSLANLGMLTADPVTRSSLHQRMIAIYEQRLGPDHPRTLDARMLAAFHTADPEQAGAAFEQLCPRFVAIGELGFAGECELERGRIEIARGRVEFALRAFEAARQLLEDPRRQLLIDAYASLGGDDSGAALAELSELIAKVEQQPGEDWWVRIEQAERRWVLAQLLMHSSAPTLAVGELERALVDLGAIAEQAQPIERARLLAGVQATLAMALAASGSEDLARIAALSSSARGFYRQWPQAYADRLQQLSTYP
jgi:eukaryotic-like serine/threonine-protein kinase